MRRLYQKKQFERVQEMMKKRVKNSSNLHKEKKETIYLVVF